MKRLTLLSLLLIAFALPAFSQEPAQDTIEKKPWFKRIFSRPTVVVHDTVFIYGSENPDEEIDDDSDELEEMHPDGGIPIPVDTLSTDDRYQKVILFDNGSWVYLDLPKPDLPDFISNDHWMTDHVHAYYDVNIKELPEEVDLVLCDSTHGWHIPGIGRITSTYKMRWGRQHQGIDIGIPFGEPIYAAFDGIVRVALPTKLTGGYGNVVVLRHANGLETYYGHMTHYVVETGDVVAAGEIIGYCGSTGHSTGPHLHFETRYMGQSFDPERIFDFREGVLRDTTFTLKKHYFSIYSHVGQSDTESENASKQVTPPAPKRVVHVVKKGETLSSIAKKHHTTVKKICNLNKISAKKTLRIGQRLIVK